MRLARSSIDCPRASHETIRGEKTIRRRQRQNDRDGRRTPDPRGPEEQAGPGHDEPEDQGEQRRAGVSRDERRSRCDHCDRGPPPTDQAAEPQDDRAADQTAA